MTQFKRQSQQAPLNLYVSERTDLSALDIKSLSQLVAVLAPLGPLWVRIYPGTEFDGHSGWRKGVFVITVMAPRRWLFPAVLFRNRSHGGLKFTNRLGVIGFLICHEASHAYFSGTDPETEFSCDLQALYFLQDLNLRKILDMPRPVLREDAHQ